MMTDVTGVTIRHALVVEDDPAFLRALATAVAGLQGRWVTHAFRHGEDAIAFCAEGAC